MAESFQTLVAACREAREAAIRELTTELQALQEGAGPSLRAELTALYRAVLSRHAGVGRLLDRLVEHGDAMEGRLARQKNELARMETLYAAGIQFSTETERTALLHKAMDVVEKALGADAGYIVLVDEQGAVSDAYGRNLDGDGEREALDLSTTVIRSVVDRSRPVRIHDADADGELARRESILHLDIKSVLCVPLIHDGKPLGAVYIDRRSVAQPFDESDLAFLVAFAHQIVQGLHVSRQFSDLENHLLADAAVTLAELRRRFPSEEIVGHSPAIFELLRMAFRIAPTDASVLILGESGTGKELFARAIHRNSRRGPAPFVAINCGAIPHDLLESELFGYEKGAFTGAVHAKPGRLETADGGTVFLDEIAEMDVRLQAKLLRVLQTREIERLGSVQPRPVDIRVLAATNRDLTERIATGAFREDLFYRLKVIALHVPPLRERREDIAELAEYFLVRFGEGRFQFDAETLEALHAYHWPGNIRELENVIQRSVVLARGARIGPDDLPPEIVGPVGEGRPPAGGAATLADAERDFRRRYIRRVLAASATKSEAARRLGINRTYLYKLLEELGIEGE